MKEFSEKELDELSEKLHKLYPDTNDHHYVFYYDEGKKLYLCGYRAPYCDIDDYIKIEDDDTVDSIIQKYKDGKVEKHHYKEWECD